MLCYNDLDRSRQSETFAKFLPASALGVKRFQRASGISTNEPTQNLRIHESN